VAFLLSIPMPVRLLGLFVLGAIGGSLINLGVYTLAFFPRAVSPWSTPPKGVPPRRPDDRVPILGWFGLRREAKVHGAGFWIRPMLVEVIAAVGLPALYGWEVAQYELARLPATVLGPLHAQFFAHAVLFALMLVASLIDIDEKTIPDAITLPGVLFGLTLAAVCPWALLSGNIVMVNGLPQIEFLRLTSPLPWPAWLAGFPHVGSLLIGLACWWLWCVALMPRSWYARHGVCRAWGLMLARLRREAVTRRLLLLGTAGSAAIGGVWALGAVRWEGLLTALVGMAAGGGIIWAVRIVGALVLRREAMGFGDVTLMAMVGTLAGWQACLIIFFLAPIAGLFVGLANLLLRRDREIPYGPFLCLATVVVIVRWASLWDWLSPLFEIGWLVPGVMGVCLVLMGVLLALWRAVLALFA
jgi:leader peptidase (prepilin peptidase)/N-methyltransferase